LLSAQRLQQLRRNTPVSLLRPLDFGKNLISKRPILAALQPLRACSAIPIQATVATVGLDGCQVNLSSAGVCRSVSAHQATIYFDKVSQRFELLNYNPLGSKVDGILYGMDRGSRKRNEFGTDSTSADAQVREYLKSVGVGVAETEMVSMAEPSLASVLSTASCQCDTRIDTSLFQSGWDGSAILRHGSLIEFGCLKFVFAYVSCAPVPVNGNSHL